MKIDIYLQCQSTDLITEVEHKLVGLLKNNKDHEVTNLTMRVGCLFVAGALAILSLAKVVASIAEPIFKGMTHLFGSLFKKDIKAYSSLICFTLAFKHTIIAVPNLLLLPFCFIFNTYRIATNGLPFSSGLLIEPDRVKVGVE